jgi:hypothetical protein
VNALAFIPVVVVGDYFLSVSHHNCMRSLHCHHHCCGFISFMKLILLISFTLRAFESLAFIVANIIIVFLLIITLSTSWLVITVFYTAYLFTIIISSTSDSTYLSFVVASTFISSFTLKIIIIFVFVHTFLFPTH